MTRPALPLAALASTLFAALPAAAQTGAEPTLRQIVVTPTPGVAQSAFDTPASVDVVEGAAIRNGQLGINLSESLRSAAWRGVRVATLSAAWPPRRHRTSRVFHSEKFARLPA